MKCVLMCVLKEKKSADNYAAGITFSLASSVSEPKSSRSKGMAATKSIRNQPLR